MTQAQPARPTTLVPLALLALGFALIIIALNDFLTLTLAPQWDNTQWRLGLMNQAIDRGILPLMGITLLCLGCWVNAYQRQKLAIQSTLMRTVLVGSLILGLFYIGITPFYFSENRLASAQTTSELNEQARQAEAQLDARLSQELGVITNLMGNEAQLQQQLKSQNLTPEQQTQINGIMAQLKEFKNDPAALQKRTTEAREQVLSQIRLEKEQAQQNVRQRFLRDAIRLSFSSLLLAAGYLTITIVGFQQGQP
jgi:hypothetical protein